MTPGVRVGTSCVTSQGMKPEELNEIGALVAEALRRPGPRSGSGSA
ncbi:hypothetical protein [Nonomuraea sp. NPDC050691]